MNTLAFIIGYLVIILTCAVGALILTSIGWFFGSGMIDRMKRNGSKLWISRDWRNMENRRDQ